MCFDSSYSKIKENGCKTFCHIKVFLEKTISEINFISIQKDTALHFDLLNAYSECVCRKETQNL